VTECSGSASDRKNATLEDMPDTKSYFESRNFSPWRDGALPVLRGRAFVVGGLLLLSLLSYATACHAQQVQPPQARSSTIPILEAGEPKDTKKLSPDDLKERGIKLRAELENIFKKLLASGKPLNRKIDITSSIAAYIPVGMTFDESERILRAAGFEVYPRPGAREAQDPNRTRDWYAVYAEKPNFSRRVLGSVTVAVSLFPESPGDYSNVKNVGATFFIEQS